MSFRKKQIFVCLLICAALIGGLVFTNASFISDSATAQEGQAPAPPEMPTFQPPQPDPLDRDDLADDNFPAETVVAEVNDAEIRVSDIHDFILDLPPQHHRELKHRQIEILDELIAWEVLHQKAGELNVEEREEYQAILQMVQDQPDPEREARIHTLIQTEVVAKAEISEDDLRELYDEYREMLPEEMTYDDISPKLRQIALDGLIRGFIAEASEEAEVERNREWIESQQAALRERMEAMPAPEEWVN